MAGEGTYRLWLGMLLGRLPRCWVAEGHGRASSARARPRRGEVLCRAALRKVVVPVGGNDPVAVTWRRGPSRYR